MSRNNTGRRSGRCCLGCSRVKALLVDALLGVVLRISRSFGCVVIGFTDALTSFIQVFLDFFASGGLVIESPVGLLLDGIARFFGCVTHVVHGVRHLLLGRFHLVFGLVLASCQ